MNLPGSHSTAWYGPVPTTGGGVAKNPRPPTRRSGRACTSPRCASAGSGRRPGGSACVGNSVSTTSVWGSVRRHGLHAGVASGTVEVAASRDSRSRSATASSTNWYVQRASSQVAGSPSDHFMSGSDLERPGQAVGDWVQDSAKPGTGSRSRPEVHQQVVVEREDLVVGDVDRVPRVEDLELLVRAGPQDERVRPAAGPAAPGSGVTRRAQRPRRRAEDDGGRCLASRSSWEASPPHPGASRARRAARTNGPPGHSRPATGRVNSRRVLVHWPRMTAHAIGAGFPARPSTRSNRAATSGSRSATASSCRPTCGCRSPRPSRPTSASRLVLEMIPYRKDDWRRASDVARGEWLAARGFAFCRLDVRGTGQLAGHRPRRVHGRETQRRLRRRRVARRPALVQRRPSGCGGSRTAASPSIQVAKLRPPHLRAIVPIYGTDDRYTDDVHYIGGCVTVCELSPVRGEHGRR